MNQYLTDQQQQILDYITHEIDNTGLAPTLHQIVYVLEIRSTNLVMNQLNVLEQKGWIMFDPFQSRGIRLTENIPSYRLTICGSVEEGRIAFDRAV
ncbi:hypothetical protein [Gimesia aquarii]|uniref:LexA repressor n=1 Tax=Gimesia aquarii TaxID=2527964 RepID=A0A517WZX2_9PLAN|nr:hypothetical protein [Gimesia aquarii]QDU10803.1 LexA repressor [Gimesia aquarii]